MSYMSDKDLSIKEDYDYKDPWSYYEEGQNAYFSGALNPHKHGTIAWSEWERGWKNENRRELILNDRD